MKKLTLAETKELRTLLFGSTKPTLKQLSKAPVYGNAAADAELMRHLHNFIVDETKPKKERIEAYRLLGEKVMGLSREKDEDKALEEYMADFRS